MNNARVIKLVLASAALVVVFYVLREHWGHALGLSPYLILLACPLLHLFHGHGHGKGQAHHEHGNDSDQPHDPARSK